jgi:hypothetical protein
VAGHSLEEMSDLTFRATSLPGQASDVEMFGHYTLEGKDASQFRYRIHGKGPEFGFTLQPVPRRHRVWLAQVIRRQLYTAYVEGQAAQKAEMRKALVALMVTAGVPVGTVPTTKWDGSVWK